MKDLKPNQNAITLSSLSLIVKLCLISLLTACGSPANRVPQNDLSGLHGAMPVSLSTVPLSSQPIGFTATGAYKDTVHVRAGRVHQIGKVTLTNQTATTQTYSTEGNGLYNLPISQDGSQIYLDLDNSSSTLDPQTQTATVTLRGVLVLSAAQIESIRQENSLSDLSEYSIQSISFDLNYDKPSKKLFSGNVYVELNKALPAVRSSGAPVHGFTLRF